MLRRMEFMIIIDFNGLGHKRREDVGRYWFRRKYGFGLLVDFGLVGEIRGRSNTMRLRERKGIGKVNGG